jgi:murein DD-endopeptidase MepM/ murein hydrolase activator NlpD
MLAPRSILLAGLITLVTAIAGGATCDDVVITFSTQQVGDTVRLFAVTRDGMDITVTVDMTLRNMASSRPLPCTVDLSGRRPSEVLILRPVNPGTWQYSYKFEWRYGGRGGRPDPAAVYALPYRPDESHLLFQGNLGKVSHGVGSENEYAFDFTMPVGSTVCAARGGIVCDVRSDSTAGGPDPMYKHCDNYVMIRHADGTYAEYVHLSPGGVRVRVGERVVTGQPIALSGVTGFTTGPHLHFSVFRVIDGYHRESLPVRFRLKGGAVATLREGVSY